MNPETSHPARSADFLSRLHDGEIDAGERAHFESHRARCAGCRRAAAEFEAALALYRASGPRPAPPDLAGRILSRLQAGNRRRRPFGVSFGIDLRWAGAFTAALVAVLIGYAVVERERPRQPTPVTLASPPREPASAVPADVGAPPPPARKSSRPSRQNAERARPALDGDAREQSAAGADARDAVSDNAFRDETARDKKEPPAAELPDAAPAGERPAESKAESKEKDRRRNPEKSDSRVPSRQESSARAAAAPAPAKDSLGGESGAGLVGSRNLAAERPLVVTILGALDSLGSAPALRGDESVELSERDRGEYVLVIDSQGRVLHVSRAQPGSPPGVDSKAPSSGVASRSAVGKLRFTAGDRPRRLRIRID